VHAGGAGEAQGPRRPAGSDAYGRHDEQVRRKEEAPREERGQEQPRNRARRSYSADV
jgi:hypothetical protein